MYQYGPPSSSNLSLFQPQNYGSNTNWFAPQQQQQQQAQMPDLQGMYSNASNANDIYSLFNGGQGFMPSPTSQGSSMLGLNNPGGLLGAGGLFSSGSLGSAGSGLGMSPAAFGGEFGAGGAGFGIGEAPMLAGGGEAAAGGAGKGGAAGGAGMMAGPAAFAAIMLHAFMDQKKQHKQARALDAHYATPQGQQEMANMVAMQQASNEQLARDEVAQRERLAGQGVY